MQALIDQGICVFCSPHVDGRAIHATRHWVAIFNDFPYEGTERHLLLIPRLHVTTLLDLPGEARDDLWDALFDVAWGEPHFSLMSRNGDPRHTGGTVEHLHIHVITANGAVRARLG